jgi:mono/diheme cytochrome c family protein
MPAYAGVLSDAEIRDVLAWIRSTWPPRLQAIQAEITARERARR